MVVSVIPTASFECRSSILFYDLLQTSVLDALENKKKTARQALASVKGQRVGENETARMSWGLTENPNLTQRIVWGDIAVSSLGEHSSDGRCSTTCWLSAILSACLCQFNSIVLFAFMMP